MADFIQMNFNLRLFSPVFFENKYLEYFDYYNNHDFVLINSLNKYFSNYAPQERIFYIKTF